MKTRAAILTQLQKPLEVTEVDTTALKRGQVLVNVKVSGVCGSQLGEIEGRKGPDPYLPHLLGHEAGGVVESIGPDVTQVKVGDHVVMHWRKAKGIEAESTQYSWNGKTANAGRVTTFQEYAVVSENRVTPIDKDISFEVAALLGCCITTGFGVIENDAKLKAGEHVLVVGAGGVGLAAILAAKIYGAATIIAADIHESKLMLARELGATHTIHSGRENVKEAVAGILKGKPLDVVLENTGITALIELCYEICGPQGRTILVGVPRADEKARIDTLPLHFGKVLTGSHGGSIEPTTDIPRIIKILRENKIDCRKFLDAKYSLDEINKAVEDLRSGRAIRPMVYMNGVKA